MAERREKSLVARDLCCLREQCIFKIALYPWKIGQPLQCTAVSPAFPSPSLNTRETLSPDRMQKVHPELIHPGFHLYLAPPVCPSLLPPLCWKRYNLPLITHRVLVIHKMIQTLPANVFGWSQVSRNGTLKHMYSAMQQ